jgi:hypothetical protein
MRRPWVDFGPNIVRGCGVRRLRSLSVWRSCCCLSSPSPSPLLPPQSLAPCVATTYWWPCIVVRCIMPALTCIDILCSIPTGVSVPRVIVCYCERTRAFACGLHDHKIKPPDRETFLVALVRPDVHNQMVEQRSSQCRCLLHLNAYVPQYICFADHE